MDIQHIRRKRLERLINEYGTQEKLGEVIGISTGYVNHMFTAYRPITEKSARRIEKACNKPDGWMDTDPGDNLSEEWNSLLAIFREAPEEKRQLAIRMMRTLLGKDD